MDLKTIPFRPLLFPEPGTAIQPAQSFPPARVSPPSRLLEIPLPSLRTSLSFPARTPTIRCSLFLPSSRVARLLSLRATRTG